MLFDPETGEEWRLLPWDPELVPHPEKPGKVLVGFASSAIAVFVARKDGEPHGTFDVGNPLEPTFAGSYDTPDWVSGVAVAGNYAYVVANLHTPSGWWARLHVVDVSNPANPVKIADYCDDLKLAFVDLAGKYALLATCASALAGKVEAAEDLLDEAIECSGLRQGGY